jgi:hypothetical protein
MQIYKYIRPVEWVLLYIHASALHPPPRTLMGEMSEAECMSDGMVKEFTPII